MNIQYQGAIRYALDSLGTRLAMLALFLVSYHEGGGEWPHTAWEWTLFVALAIVSVYGLRQSRAGASTVALK